MLEVTRLETVVQLQRQKALYNTYSLALFVNNWTPSPDDDLGDYTLATFAGSTPKALTLWGDAFLNADLFAEIDETMRTFTVTGAPLTELVYGYVVFIGGTLAWAERSASAPFAMSAVGLTYSVQPIMTLRNLSEA